FNFGGFCRGGSGMTAVMNDPSFAVEGVESFRFRARTWIQANLKRLESHPREELTDEQELTEVKRQLGIQRMLFDAGLAGIVVPKAYGGQGLTRAHALVFNE